MLPDEELADVVARVPWDDLRGARILLTGATGFFGRWLVESFARANVERRLGARLVAAARAPAEALDGVEVVVTDVRTPAAFGAVTHLIHAATSTVESDPRELVSTIVDGTRRVLDAVRGARVLYVSSGAIYGRQPPPLSHVSEEHRGGPDPLNPRQAYAEGKRVAELLSVLDGAVVARPFSFVGPAMRLGAHFAIGNFIADACAGREIVVAGDGTPERSYLYAQDLAVWLWTMLLRGAPGRAYNVGSEHAVSIGELAHRVGERFGLPVRIRGVADGQPLDRYVPSTARARSELGLEETIPLDEAIMRTARFYRDRV